MVVAETFAERVNVYKSLNLPYSQCSIHYSVVFFVVVVIVINEKWKPREAVTFPELTQHTGGKAGT